MFAYDLKVGYSCNNNCKHCIIENNKQQLEKSNKMIDCSTEECKNKISNIAESDIFKKSNNRKIVLTGGEPTIRNDLFDICKKAVDEGFDFIELQTNGRNLKDYELAKKLIYNLPIHFVIPLHGDLEEVHDHVTGRRGSYKETIMAMNNIKLLQGNVIGKVIVTKLNYKYIGDIVKRYNEYGVTNMNIAFVHSGIGDDRFFDVVPRYSDIKKYIKEALDYGSDNGILITVEAMPLCFMENYEYLISEFEIQKKQSVVTPVNENDLDWNCIRMQLKDKGSKCGKCLLNTMCEGVWKEYLYYYGDEEFDPIISAKRAFKAIKLIETYSTYDKR